MIKKSPSVHSIGVCKCVSCLTSTQRLGPGAKNSAHNPAPALSPGYGAECPGARADVRAQGHSLRRPQKTRAFL